MRVKISGRRSKEATEKQHDWPSAPSLHLVGLKQIGEELFKHDPHTEFGFLPGYS